MKALVYEGVGQRAWKGKERSGIEHPTDAIVRMTHTTTCGTDLHILKGNVPAVTSGRTLGQEGIGWSRMRLLQAEHVRALPRWGGFSVTRSMAPRPSSCASRIPHVANSLYQLLPGLEPAAALVLSDILPTGQGIGGRGLAEEYRGHRRFGAHRALRKPARH